MSENPFPSYADIQAILEPRIEELNAKTLYARFKDPSTPPIHYRSVVRELGVTPTSSATLLGEQYEFLCEIRNHPEDGLRNHYERLSWGIEKGNRVLRELKAAGCVMLKSVKSKNPKGGRARLIASTTPNGQAFLRAYEKRCNQPELDHEQ